jgi:hypothetical protein
MVALLKLFSITTRSSIFINYCIDPNWHTFVKSFNVTSRPSSFLKIYLITSLNFSIELIFLAFSHILFFTWVQKRFIQNRFSTTICSFTLKVTSTKFLQNIWNCLLTQKVTLCSYLFKNIFLSNSLFSKNTYLCLNHSWGVIRIGFLHFILLYCIFW